MQHLHIHDFGGLVDSNRQVVPILGGDQQLFQRCPCTLQP